MDVDFYTKTNEVAAMLRKPNSNKVLAIPNKAGKRITSRNMDVVLFMREFLRNNDRMPAMKDISINFGWSSCNAAVEHVRKLIELGELEVSGACWYRFSREKKLLNK